MWTKSTYTKSRPLIVIRLDKQKHEEVGPISPGGSAFITGRATLAAWAACVQGTTSSFSFQAVWQACFFNIDTSVHMEM